MTALQAAFCEIIVILVTIMTLRILVMKSGVDLVADGPASAHAAPSFEHVSHGCMLIGNPGERRANIDSFLLRALQAISWASGCA